MSNISIKGLYKTYGTSVEAVKSLDLDIEDGELLCLIGPSGCGKTTTLRMVAGLESVTSGEIYIGDQLINEVPPRDRNIAMIFENYALYPHMTVRQNMATPLVARGMPKAMIEERVMHAAKVLAIVDLLPKRVRGLSGGQKQRVGIGRAIVREPAVFLMDEPISHLDAQLRIDLRGELRRLHITTKATTIYVTHDQLEALAIADRIAVMNLGVLQQVGKPFELFDHPANMFVAGFIGSPPMNMLRCELSTENGQARLVGEGFSLLLDGEMTTKVCGASCRNVVLGVRSIDLNVCTGPYGEAGTISGRAIAWEPLGDRAEVEVEIGGQPVLAAADPRRLGGQDEQVALEVDMSRVHVFDESNGTNLLA